jgi:hypothetical protein
MHQQATGVKVLIWIIDRMNALPFPTTYAVMVELLGYNKRKKKANPALRVLGTGTAI